MRISIGKTRKDTHWKVVDLSWAEIVQKLSSTIRTSETVADYKAMNKDSKAEKKDVGGFVGGVVVNGRRKNDNISARSLVTLDADFADENIWDDVEMLFDYAIACYSTHSHTPKSPRLRFVIPLDREVTPEEYEPIARKIASDLGIDMFDITTYETSRLMFWPSTPSDGEFIFHENKGEFLSADETLARYIDWTDSTEWPLGSSEVAVRTKQAKAQGTPEEKPGAVGLFCKTYDIPTAIDTFLADVYEPCDIPNRYTYINGTTTAGVVVYEDGKFAYSHHSTDPAGGKLCNSFDLVRLHKFADLDADADKDTPINKLPSYKAMCDYVHEDDLVKQQLVEENLLIAREAFGDSTPQSEIDELDWASQLKLNKGQVEATTDNLVIILENDPHLSGALAKNLFTDRLCIIADVPWRKCDDERNGSAWTDTDDSALRVYLEKVYGIYSQTKVTDALSTVMLKHSFHPVRDYLQSLQWDGVKRAEHLFIHYLGAEENEYTLTVTRKWLAAAVARVMHPGCKFDNLVVLVGAQGIGKSYLGKQLGKEWFSDTFTTIQGKEAYEQLGGAWVMEIGELSAMRKAEVEAVKMFISKQEDSFRAAYGRHAKVNKRQCVFYGTTNDDSFLRDKTGNRRFWPIGVDNTKAIYEVFDLASEDIDQIWAEAFTWWKSGETLYLNARVSALAEKEQEKYTVLDPRQGMVEDYLDTPLPISWYEMDKTERRNYIQGYTSIDPDAETIIRKEISVPELAYELFGEEVLQPWQAKEYHGILTAIKGWHKTGKRKRSIYGQQIYYERGEL